MTTPTPDIVERELRIKEADPMLLGVLRSILDLSDRNPSDFYDEALDLAARAVAEIDKEGREAHPKPAARTLINGAPTMADDPTIDEEWRAALLLWAMVRDEDDRSRMLRTAVVVQGMLAPDLSFRELLRRAVAARRERLGWVAF